MGDPEREAWPAHPLIVGVDEAGRGPWAGPVVAAAVVFPRWEVPPVDLATMRAKLAPLGAVTGNAYLLRLDYDGHEVTLFADGRAIIGGVEDESQARSVWNRIAGG